MACSLSRNPEALTEGETEEEARANARDCVISALEGYMKAGKPLAREGAGHSGPDRAVLPSLGAMMEYCR